MKYYALFAIVEKAAKFENCRLLQIKGGARVNLRNITYSVRDTGTDIRWIFYPTMSIDIKLSLYELSDSH